MKKGSDTHWREAVRSAAEKPKAARGGPTAARRKQRGKAETPALTERVALGTYVSREILADLHDLAAKLYRQRGGRVTLADLVTEALTDLLAKYRK